MTEPKVVHEWTDEYDDATWHHMVDNEGGYHQVDDECKDAMGYNLIDDIHSDVVDELARLAARVKELERDYMEAYEHMAMQDGMTVRAEKYNKLKAENTRLREAIIDAKRLSTGEPWRILDAVLEEKP